MATKKVEGKKRMRRDEQWCIQGGFCCTRVDAKQCRSGTATVTTDSETPSRRRAELSWGWGERGRYAAYAVM